MNQREASHFGGWLFYVVCRKLRKMGMGLT